MFAQAHLFSFRTTSLPGLNPTKQALSTSQALRISALKISNDARHRLKPLNLSLAHRCRVVQVLGKQVST